MLRASRSIRVTMRVSPILLVQISCWPASSIALECFRLGGLFLQQGHRRLAAILAADVVGYSRLMAADESATLALLRRLRSEVIEPKITEFQGRIVGSAGDSPLVEFASAVNAVQCAVEAQERLADQNSQLPEHRRMAFRIGVNLGDVIAEGDTFHGEWSEYRCAT